MTAAQRLAIRLDPSRVLDAAGITPDDWQRQVLRSESPSILLNAARQSGKTLVCGGMATFTALFDPGLILCVAPATRQSGELFRVIGALMDALGRPVGAVKSNESTLELENGARVIVVPAKPDNVRGFSAVKLLLIDEASRVNDATFLAMSPMLAVSGGRLVALSTPAGKQGFWSAAWHDPEAGWERFTLRADQNPRVTPAFLARERALMGPRWYRQEYECSFEDTIDQFFDTESVDAAFTANVPPLFAEPAPR